MIKVNEYFDGKVKSLGFELGATPYTVGVIMEGTYTFNTEKIERLDRRRRTRHQAGRGRMADTENGRFNHHRGWNFLRPQIEGSGSLHLRLYVNQPVINLMGEAWQL